MKYICDATCALFVENITGFPWPLSFINKASGTHASATDASITRRLRIFPSLFLPGFETMKLSHDQLQSLSTVLPGPEMMSIPNPHF